MKDIIHRKEAFEFQAIRYAASYATIDMTDDLVKKVYGWSSVDTFAFAMHKEANKTMSEIRKEYMKQENTEDADI